MRHALSKFLLNFYIKSQRDCRTSVPSARRHKAAVCIVTFLPITLFVSFCLCGSIPSRSHTVFIKWERCGHLTLWIFTGKTQGWSDVKISQDANLSGRSPWCSFKLISSPTISTRPYKGGPYEEDVDEAYDTSLYLDYCNRKFPIKQFIGEQNDTYCCLDHKFEKVISKRHPIQVGKRFYNLLQGFFFICNCLEKHQPLCAFDVLLALPTIKRSCRY